MTARGGTPFSRAVAGACESKKIGFEPLTSEEGPGMTNNRSESTACPDLSRRHVLAGAGAWSVMAMHASQAAAQAYPTQNIMLIVPFTPGGSTDILARLLGQRLEAALKYPVIIEIPPWRRRLHRNGLGGPRHP